MELLATEVVTPRSSYDRYSHNSGLSLGISRGAWCGGEWPDSVDRHGSRFAMHGASGTVPERGEQGLSKDVSFVYVRAELEHFSSNVLTPG